MPKLAATMLVLSLAYPSLLLSQPGLPPHGPVRGPKPTEQRIAEVRARLSEHPPVTAGQKELAVFVHRYLDQAGKALGSGQPFMAERLVDAADACRRPIDHLAHLDTPGKPPPPDLSDRLRQIYFRLQLSDYFLKQIPAPAPTRLLELARRFYESAVKAQQDGQLATADEYAKSADDLTHALETLAQAALPTRPTPPPRP
jgi:hypothetical protein